MQSFFSSQYFLREVENTFSLFLSSYKNTRESLGELKKAVETIACKPSFPSISCSPELPFVFLKLDRNMVHVFNLTNRFHVAVRLFSNRSQMTSKCDKNKKVAGMA